MNHSLFFLMGILLISCGENAFEPQYHPQSGASKALEAYSILRSYPNGTLHSQQWISEAYRFSNGVALRNERQWQSLGPSNIGGRTLCLAFHEEDPNIIYAGSASGGLWRTNSGGIGEDAWEHVPTGHPVLGIGAIAINPEYPSQLLIGTGEVYNYGTPQPGIVDRLTRGTYGIGILKSDDGGNHWTKVLSWDTEALTGVQDIAFDPNSNFVFAATTEGLYRSYDKGNTWVLLNAYKMAVDIEFIPSKPGHMWITFGSLNSEMHGVYFSSDYGNTFDRADLVNYTGRAKISFCESDPDVGYLYMADVLKGKGLFKTIDGGEHWNLKNPTDVPEYQGWYAVNVAVDPEDKDKVICAGIDIWDSEDGGTSLLRRSNAKEGFMGMIPAGGPEGSDKYVHADVHGVYFHPHLSEVIYYATDGGIFRSEDGGKTFRGCNGGYVTSQFYAEFAISRLNQHLAVGGMQDNGTAKYVGTTSWSKILGGDGMTSVLPMMSNNPLFSSMQELQLRRSTDFGNNFVNISPVTELEENKAFSAPFVISPSQPGVLYAGTERLYKTINGGNTWTPTTQDPISGGDPILKIAVSNSSPNVLYLCTVPLQSGKRKVFKSNNSGLSFMDISDGLPDLICTDIAIHSEDADIVYLTFSGFGSGHVYRSINGGLDWEARSEELPDLPTNAIALDEKHPDHVYIGNDMGVFASIDGGVSWKYISSELSDVTMVTDLQISYLDETLVVITHGKGVYKTNLIRPSVIQPEGNIPISIKTFPNPTSDVVNIVVNEKYSMEIVVELVDIHGRILQSKNFVNGSGYFNISSYPPGAYFILGKEGLGSKRILFNSRIIRKKE